MSVSLAHSGSVMSSDQEIMKSLLEFLGVIAQPTEKHNNSRSCTSSLPSILVMILYRTLAAEGASFGEPQESRICNILPCMLCSIGVWMGSVWLDDIGVVKTNRYLCLSLKLSQD